MGVASLTMGGNIERTVGPHTAYLWAGAVPFGEQRVFPADPWRFPKHWGVCYHSGRSIFHSFFHSSIHGAANKQNKEFHFRVVGNGLFLVWL